MTRLLPLTICLLLAGALHAQENSSADSLLPPVRRFEIGLNITNTLVRFFGTQSTGRADDPYMLAFRVGGPRQRLRMGLNFLVRDREEGSFQFNGESEKETDADLRVGYEWVQSITRRIGLYWGLDAVGTLEYDQVLSFSPVTGSVNSLESRVWGMGGGPVLGVLWRAHPRVTLSTESSVYAVYSTGFAEVQAQPVRERTTIREFSWRPILPSSLYVNFAF